MNFGNEFRLWTYDCHNIREGRDISIYLVTGPGVDNVSGGSLNTESVVSGNKS